MWVVNPARGGQKEVTAAVAERAWSEAQEAAREAPGEVRAATGCLSGWAWLQMLACLLGSQLFKLAP